MHFAALFGEGGNSAVFLDGGSAVVSGAVCAEEGEQTGGEAGAGSGEGGEEFGVLVLGGFCGDELVEFVDAGLYLLELFDED